MSYKLKTLNDFIRYRSAEFDQWWDRSLIPDSKLKLESVCEYLCTYCSYRFNVWFYKNLFDYDRCYGYLFSYCKHKFDIWFDKEKFKDFVLKYDSTNIKISTSFMKGYNIETIFVPEMLASRRFLHELNTSYYDKKSFWLDKNKINFDLESISYKLISECSKDISLWFDKNKFKYTPETCELFASSFEDVDARREFQRTFRLWWDEDKFDFSKILKDPRKLASWENIYSSFRSYWEKKLMLEKLRR